MVNYISLLKHKMTQLNLKSWGANPKDIIVLDETQYYQRAENHSLQDHCIFVIVTCNFPDDNSGKEPACQCRSCKRCSFNPWVGKIPWKRKWQPTPAFLPGDSMDRGAWKATVHGVSKELDMTDRLSYLLACYMPDPALTHSSLKSTKQGVGAIIFILQQVRNQRYTDTR